VTTGKPFDPERDAPLLSAYVDGELDSEDADRVQQYLNESPQAQREVARLRELKELTSALALKDAPAETWEVFWRAGYHRTERSLGWILLIAGLAIVAVFALYVAIKAILAAASLPWIVKAAVLCGGAGLVVLFVSVLRERLFTRKRTRYDDVVR
jgi:anti-sigma factor RsiW